LYSLLFSQNLPNQILAFLKKYAYYYGHIAGKTLDLNPDLWFKSEVFDN